MRTTHIPISIIVFFARNEDEELCIEDVQRKFSTTYYAAQKALWRLHKNGWLIKHEVGRTGFYSINPKMLESIMK